MRIVLAIFKRTDILVSKQAAFHRKQMFIRIALLPIRIYVH